MLAAVELLFTRGAYTISITNRLVIPRLPRKYYELMPQLRN